MTQNAAPVATPKRKSILVFSDGTGNSSAKLFKTNVWRLYRAVDLSPVPPSGPRQIAAYDDGVGTSAFMPLRLLGGMFGVGLRRNVLDLYRFVCRNYAPGDRIYAFGFSRGAFTARVLVGLIAQQGIVRARNEAELVRLTESAYREFRRCFRLAGNRPLGSGGKLGDDWTSFLVDRLRRLRDRVSPRPSVSGRSVQVPRIRFVGVWDTVAAYGSPVAEVTRGIDRWIWPLSMPDYNLSSKVTFARHALALDDERDTFHPLLWNETHEAWCAEQHPYLKRRLGWRLRQVWFPGMHADVGGGYADDSLAYVPLVWMLDEAKRAGLRLKPAEEAAIRATADPFGPLHDSRAGLGSYYRYQPRKVASRLDPPDSTTRAQQDPELGNRGLLTEVRLHDSVAQRIAAGTDAYSPIVLPSRYVVENGHALERLPGPRAAAQERVWDLVWRRRVNYFSTLAATLGLASMPLVNLIWSPGLCLGPQCTIAPIMRSLAGVVPWPGDIWVEAFASRPGTFLTLVLIIILLRSRSSAIETSARAVMRGLLDRSREGKPGGAAALNRLAGREGLAWRIRSSPTYQEKLQSLKWRFVPALVGLLGLLLMCATAVSLLVLGAAAVHRVHMAYAERSQSACVGVPPGPTMVFFTKDPCSLLPGTLRKGVRYQLRMTVVERWRDGRIATDPAGFDSKRLPAGARIVGPLLRRSMNERWFTPIISIKGRGWTLGATRAVPMRRLREDRDEYVGEFELPVSGRPVLAINDAVLLWSRDPYAFYTREEGANAGTAKVRVLTCDESEATCEDR